MDKKNVLVFPCGSEIGLEIYRSLKYSIHFKLYGGSSIDDHGRFVYENYINGIPFFDYENFINSINEVISKYKIDIIYPTMDSVIYQLSLNSSKINCKIACSDVETTEICLSKTKTYKLFDGLIKIPHLYQSIDEVKSYPVFLKPDIGYSGRGTLKAENKKQATLHLINRPDCLILENLPGEEYTVDCFTDFKRNLLFCGARLRNRISNGISVSSIEANENVQSELELIAKIINKKLRLRGAWFFQVKKDKDNVFRLLEVADRLGGSSAFFRMKGINFALLTLWDLLDKRVDITLNRYEVEMDRALDIKYKLNLSFETIYVDLDDAIIIEDKVNELLIAFLYKCLNDNKSLILLTKHLSDVQKTLAKYRIDTLFDKIIQINKNQEKSDFINKSKSIFIDDSFAERAKVAKICKIPVFDLNMIDGLL